MWTGTPPNQSFQRTDGTRTGTQTWQKAAADGIDIVATDHDTHDQDLADGINGCVKRDGGNAPTDNLPMGGFRHTNVGAATSRQSYVQLGQLQDGTVTSAAVGGTANAITLTTGFSVPALAMGYSVEFFATANNTGSVTVAVDGLPAKDLVRPGNIALQADDIVLAGFYRAVYNGSYFQLVSSGGSQKGFGLRVGDVKLSLGNTPDAGFLRLKETAQVYNRVDYPDLWPVLVAMTGYPWGATVSGSTFATPPAAGYFLRFAASNASVDTSGARAAGSTQADLVGAHTHGATATTGVNVTVTTAATDGHVVLTSGSGYTIPGGTDTQSVGAFPLTSTATATATTNVTVTSNVGSENRTKNVAMHADMLAVPALVASGLVGVNGFAYKMASGTGATDPGSGYLRFNNATLSSATELYISETDANGTSLAGVLASLPANTGVYITKVGAPANWIWARLTNTVTDNGAWGTFPVTAVSSAGTISSGDAISVVVHIAGQQGAQGAAGASGSDGGIRFAYDASTTMAAPSAGGIRFDNAALGSITAFAIANTSGETGNPSVAAWINSWDDSTTTAHRGQITIRKQNAAENFVILDLTSAVTDNTTWLTGTVSVVASAGSLSAADILLVSFSRTGDKGLDGAGSGTVTSLTAGAGLSSTGVGSTGGSLTVSGTLTQVEAVNAQTGTSYIIVAGDHAKLVTLSNGSAVAVTLGQATGSFAAGWFCDVANKGAGVVTITPTTSTINGAASFVLSRSQSVRVVSDGTNWQVAQGRGIAGATTTVASASTTDIGAIATDRVSITGTTTITSFGSTPNQVRFGTFTGALTLTHNATSLILPSGANITTAAGDSFIAASDGSGNWRVTHYSKADGTAVVGGAGGSGSPSVPQGRLTLSTATPVMTSSVSSATTVYYTPHIGQYVPIYNGSTWTMTDIGGELSQATTDAAKSPAACAANSNYDLFVWSDSGTYRCTRGPAWSSDTARGTGAGTTELQMVNGIWTNKNAITNGPAANRGTYVGTIRTNGSSQVDWVPGGTASGGTPAYLHVWNMYNRIDVTAEIFNSTSSYTWAPGSSTFRAAGGTNAIRCSFIMGVQQDTVCATYAAVGQNSNAWVIGVGIDKTTGIDSSSFYGNVVTAGVGKIERSYIGFHYAQAIEWTNTATSTFYGAPVTGVPGIYFSLKGRF